MNMTPFFMYGAWLAGVYLDNTWLSLFVYTLVVIGWIFYNKKRR